MNEITQSIQVSFFGSFEEVTASHETILFFLTKFAEKKLIPATFQALELPQPLRIAINVAPRFSFRSEDGTWTIDFGPRRIDIRKQNVGIKSANSFDVESFYGEVLNDINSICERLNRSFSRLSFVSNYAFEGFDDFDLQRITGGLFASLPRISEEPLTEWSTRVVEHIKIKMKSEELLNVISTLNRGPYQVFSEEDDEKRVLLILSFDINTHQSNLEPRFNQNDVKEFLSRGMDIEARHHRSYTKVLQKIGI